jgi:hypothetical protein
MWSKDLWRSSAKYLLVKHIKHKCDVGFEVLAAVVMYLAIAGYETIICLKITVYSTKLCQQIIDIKRNAASNKFLVPETKNSLSLNQNLQMFFYYNRSQFHLDHINEKFCLS